MSTRLKKKLLAAWFAGVLVEAIERWRGLHPRKSVSDFLIEAGIEKLEKDGIQFDHSAALWDRRTKRPVSYFDRVAERPELNEKHSQALALQLKVVPRGTTEAIKVREQ